MTSDPEGLKRQLTAFAKFTTQSLAESDLDTLISTRVCGLAPELTFPTRSSWNISLVGTECF